VRVCVRVLRLSVAQENRPDSSWPFSALRMLTLRFSVQSGFHSCIAWLFLGRVLH
jgi:hypothetical protein